MNHIENVHTSAELEEVVSKVRDLLVPELNPSSIYLYGSYVWGVPHEHSDIDICIVVKVSPDYNRVALTKQAYKVLEEIEADLDLFVQSDVSMAKYGGVESSMQNKILTKGRRLL